MEQSHREKHQEKEIRRLKKREAHLEGVVAGLQSVMKKNDLLARVEKLEVAAGIARLKHTS
jgi:hypothetical protein